MATDYVATEKDWASYGRAVIDFAPPGRPPFRLVPEAPGVTGVWPLELMAPVLIVTAWNPDSIILPVADNRARNQLLVAELDRRGLIFWPAVGRDPDTDHHEDGFAISGLTPDEGVTLGLRHGQAAVFVWTPVAIAVVSCRDDRHHSSGWRLGDIPSNTGGPITTAETLSVCSAVTLVTGLPALDTPTTARGPHR